MATVTVPDVELVSAGTWDASTGRSTITPDDLASAAQAYSDHLVDKPAVKIGHTDPRFADGNHDGAPAFGWIENIRTSADGQKLLGDLVGVPAKLADIMTAAYRRRSVEMSFGVRTAAGKVYRAVVTGVALLGATAPAIKNLADVAALYSAGNTAQDYEALLITGELHGDTPTVHHTAQFGGDGAPSTQTSNPGGHVPISEAVRKALGLADGATAEQTNEALTAAGLPPLPATDGGQAPAGGGAGTPAAMPATQAPAPQAQAQTPAPLPVAAAAPAGQYLIPVGYKLVKEEDLANVEQRLAAGEAARTQQLAEGRHGIIAQFSQAGKILPGEEPLFLKLLESDQEGTVKTLTDAPARVHMFSAGAAIAPPHLSDSQVGDISPEVMAAAAASIGFKLPEGV